MTSAMPDLGMGEPGVGDAFGGGVGIGAVLQAVGIEAAAAATGAEAEVDTFLRFKGPVGPNDVSGGSR